MKMMIVPTVHNSLRVYITGPSSTCITVMDCISIWGGPDKIGFNYGS